MAPRLKVEGRLGRAFRTLLAKRMKKALTHLEAAGGDLEAGVHEARKEFKAGRSLARMLRDLDSEKEYKEINRALRDAGHAVACLRDAHAMGDAIGLLVSETGMPTEAAEPLRKAAGGGEPDQPETPAQDPDQDPDEALRAAWELVAPLPEKVKHLQLPDDPAPYVASLGRTYSEARRALRQGFKTLDAEDLHDARKRVINWRYQLDAVAPIWQPVIKAEVGELQALREHLGQHNDLVMLQRALQGAEGPWAEVERREEWIERADEVRGLLAERAEFASRLLFIDTRKQRMERLAGWWEAVRRAQA